MNEKIIPLRGRYFQQLLRLLGSAEEHHGGLPENANLVASGKEPEVAWFVYHLPGRGHLVELRYTRPWPTTLRWRIARTTKLPPT